MESEVRHSQELKDAKAAAELKLDDTLKEFTNSSAVLRTELEEESKARKAAEERIAALTTDQAAYDQLVVQADALALSKSFFSFLSLKSFSVFPARSFHICSLSFLLTSLFPILPATFSHTGSLFFFLPQNSFRIHRRMLPRRWRKTGLSNPLLIRMLPGIPTSILWRCPPGSAT
jgi:hypothetical protein